MVSDRLGTGLGSDIFGHIDNIVLVDIITLERKAEGSGHKEGTEDC